MLEVTERYLTKQEQAVRNLRSAILDGTLKPGQHLRQDEVAAATGLSRTPVREAFRQLEAEGLVAIRAHRGAVVAEVSLDELEEIYLMRMALEGLASRLGAEAATADTLARMREILAQLESLVGPEARVDFLRLEKDFHAAHYHASGRKRLCDLVASLRDSSECYIRASFAEPGHTERALALYRGILGACERGDGALAEVLVKEALRWTVDTVRDRIRDSRTGKMPALQGSGKLAEGRSK